MRLSSESKYAIAALSSLARRPEPAIEEAATIAGEAGLPAPFLSKIFAKLSKHGIVTSHRGRERGYRLARAPELITIREVLEAIEGPDLFTRCLFWSETCSDDSPCPLHHTWAGLRSTIAQAMENVTIADIARSNAVREASVIA